MEKITSRPTLQSRSMPIGCAAAVVVLWMSLACNLLTPSSSPTDQAGTANGLTPTPAAPSDLSPTAPVAETSAAPVVLDASSLLGEPDPSANPHPLTILEQWFGVDRVWNTRLDFAMVVKNPNEDWGYPFVPFTVTLYDKAGNRLADPIDEDLGMILPGQTVAFYNEFGIPEKAEVGKVDVQFRQSTPNKSGAQGFPLRIDKMKLVQKGDDLSATGIINNSLDKDIDFLGVEALGYDETGKLGNGGGGVPINFIPGNGQVAVEVRLGGKEKPARVERIPKLMMGSQFEPPSDEVKDIHINGVGVSFGTANSANYTAVFENTSQAHFYKDLVYTFAIYAEDGSVLAAGSGNPQYLFPKGQIAVHGSMTVPADARVARADIQFNYYEPTGLINTNDKTLKLKANPLSASPDVAITEDDYYYDFSGTISNSLDEAIDGADVVTVAYDDQNKIIGSGFAYANVPARGNAEVKISLMKTLAKPARVVLFPSLPGNWGG
jgi:hypothetical protein